MWESSINDVVQTKHVKFEENISGYEYVYHKVSYEISSITYNNVNKIDETEQIDREIDIEVNNDIDDDNSERLENTNENADENRISYNLRSSGRSDNLGETSEIKENKVIRNL